VAREIERKFRVVGEGWRTDCGVRIRQGYLSTVPERSVRVRVAGGRATLTVKGPSEGIARAEYEYQIPVAEAEQMLDRLCVRPLIEKIRHRVDHGGRCWEVDEFVGENEGLVIAEIELDDESQAIDRPAWLGEEVSHDPRFFNASLVRSPYATWGDPG